jgi:hypothetical protein
VPAPYLSLRAGAPASLNRALSRLAGAYLQRQAVEFARALLVHCAQEMSHLATFLPDLHAALSPPDLDVDADET